MAYVNLSVQENLHMSFQHSLLLLYGGNTGA